MPIYEYLCQDCSHRFEKLVSASGTPCCPSCSSQKLEQQFSTFAVGGRSQQRGAQPEPMGACGSCGDLRGPGSCALN